VTIADSKLSAEESRLLTEGQIEIIPATGIKIIKINSFEAAEYYQERVNSLYYGGGNTQWCFARTETDFNNSYQVAPIYIIFNGRVYFALYSCGRGYVFKLVNENDGLINIAEPLFTLFSENFTKHLLTLNGKFIRWCTNPSIGLQLIAVKQDGESIQYIENPSPMIQSAACRQNPEAINYINPDLRDPSLVAKYKKKLEENVDSVTTEATLIASGQVRIFFENAEIKILEVKSYRAVNFYISGSTLPFNSSNNFDQIKSYHPIYLIFDKKYRFIQDLQTIAFFKHENKYFDSRAYFRSIYDNSLHSNDISYWVKKFPPSFIKIVLAANGMYIDYVQNPSIAEQLISVQQNGFAIVFIDKPLPMIQAAACRQNPEAINYINPDFRDPTLVAKYGDHLNE